MSNVLNAMRDFAAGKINESVLRGQVAETNTDSGYDFENDEMFMQECADACVPLIIEDMLMDESSLENLEEDVREAFLRVKGYLVENGVMSEATVSLSNPKVTVVKMSKAARKNRLTSIIALKMARKDNSNAYKKYKLGQRIKKENFSTIMSKYGAKAERLANKLIMKTKKGKVGAVVEAKKAEKKK